VTELSTEFADALMLKVYGLSREELGKLTQRHFSELLENIGGVIVFEQTGKIVDRKAEIEKDRKNILWTKKHKKEMIHG